VRHIGTHWDAAQQSRLDSCSASVQSRMVGGSARRRRIWLSWMRRDNISPQRLDAGRRASTGRSVAVSSRQSMHAWELRARREMTDRCAWRTRRTSRAGRGHKTGGHLGVCDGIRAVSTRERAGLLAVAAAMSRSIHRGATRTRPKSARIACREMELRPGAALSSSRSPSQVGTRSEGPGVPRSPHDAGPIVPESSRQ